MSGSVLTDQQIEHFLERGHVVIKGCFDRSLAEPWTDFAFKRLGYDKHDLSTWKEPVVHMPRRQEVSVQTIALHAWKAICELLGGEDRLVPEYLWHDGFIANFHLGSNEPWQPPSVDISGWHKDGDAFRHFLDSPEQGLLTLMLFSDIAPRGGGTFVAPDSVPVVSRYLADHPEGVLPTAFPVKKLIGECSEFIEVTGEVGDLILLHPFILHASSQNHSGTARFLINPPVALREPMNFDREDPNEFSLVERAILRGLGVERYAFKPTSPREEVIPERRKMQAKLLEEERARLGETG